ncbi:hypothetical protein ACTI_16460 [Actinoplanes sp. OR16]|uniref:hypothetical protein n=1 Tax=Actinoplanes sp. OR16 TaxID=946334 RepID=UPI000F71959E|nr:hypothetical protein [Actinoplanes sp. OR16]BBH64961.1 hypothetical protein ACTI_16460 [Actinoplanes sp. OR16]
MIRPSVLLFALLMTAPALYRLLVDQLDLLQVLIRFLIAVPIAAVLLAGVRFILAGYRKNPTDGTAVTPEPIDNPTPEKPA